jgi:hypothetical protein
VLARTGDKVVVDDGPYRGKPRREGQRELIEGQLVVASGEP